MQNPAGYSVKGITKIHHLISLLNSAKENVRYCFSSTLLLLPILVLFRSEWKADVVITF